MPTKAERRVPLPAGLVPLLTQPELETYYRVSEWTVLKWIDSGMPSVILKPARKPVDDGKPERQHRRFDLDDVKAWHADNPDVLAASA